MTAPKTDITDEELVEKVIEVEDLTVTSVEDLDSFIKLLGYKGSGSCPMTSTIDFLGDNPGAIEAILEWVASNLSPEQRTNLENVVPLDDEPEPERIHCCGCGIPINMPPSDNADPDLLLCDTCLDAVQIN